MTYRYIAEVKDGTRRMMRMLNDGARETDFRRRALTPASTGKVMWEYPTVWLMGHDTGYWETMVVPKLEERVARSSWKMILGKPTDNSRAAGEKDDVWGDTSGWKERGKKDTKYDAYPAGIPLSKVEIESPVTFAPTR